MPRIRTPRPGRAYVATAVALALAAPWPAAPAAHAAPAYAWLHGPSGTESRYASVSPTGRWVAYVAHGADTTAGTVWLYDRQRGTQTLVSATPSGKPATGESFRPDVSADGRYVVFDSTAADLVPGDRNGTTDVFLRDMVLRRTVRLSVGPRGVEAKANSWYPHVSADGRTVVFTSCADLSAAKPASTGCTVLLLWRRAEPGRLRRVVTGVSGSWTSVSVSPNGRYVAFASNASLTPDDTDDDACRDDIYVLDTTTGALVRASKALPEPVTPSACGIGGRTYTSPQFDDSGRYVAFAAQDDPGAVSTSGSAILVRDLQTGAVTTAADSSTGLNLSTATDDWAFSGDGRHLAFTAATTVGATPSATTTAVYLKDLKTGGVTRVSMPPNDQTQGCEQAGAPGCAEGAGSPTVSSDGRVVAFETNVALAAGDTNDYFDDYVWTAG